MPDRDTLYSLSKKTLIEMLEDSAKNWLAHDGLWFQAVERQYGIEKAIELDKEAWISFTQIEAKRIMRLHEIEPGGGIPALQKALQFRLYARVNEQSMTSSDERTLRFEMNDCRVQSARKRKGLDDFPCKPVGIAEYAYFAHTIDPRIRTAVISCPPDPHPEDFYCAWQFSLEVDPIPLEDLIRIK
ncbi:MAG: hypothetical protein J7L35_10195 [Anaerolineales bacterium]|nr:hypothetical protein [Anaerolineales bacterium]